MSFALRRLDVDRHAQTLCHLAIASEKPTNLLGRLVLAATHFPAALLCDGHAASDPVPACTPAQGARHLVGIGSPTQLRYLPVLENRLAIDGILKSFQRRLEMLQARLENCGARIPADLCHGRHRVGASRRIECSPWCHWLRTSAPLMGVSRERKRKRDPTSEPAGPASLDHWPRAPRLGAITRW